MSVQLDNIDRLGMQLRRCSNIYRNNVLFNRLDLKQKELLADNVKYKDIYKGKKCFVVGNGPSVNRVDFNKLSDEIVITVNDMVCHNNFGNLNSNFHFLADPAYLRLKKRDVGEAQIIKKMKCLSKSNTTLFFPVHGFDITKKYGWYNKINISFFSSKLYFYDDYREKIDFTKYIPAFQGVIHWCIAFAVYMGCSEIYLLGCDMTDVVNDLSLFIDRNVDLNYAFDLSKESTDYAKKIKVGWGLEYTLYGYWKIVRGFFEMYKYCRRNDVKVFNCSEESILESIPKKRIEDIL